MPLESRTPKTAKARHNLFITQILPLKNSDNESSGFHRVLERLPGYICTWDSPRAGVSHTVPSRGFTAGNTGNIDNCLTKRKFKAYGKLTFSGGCGRWPGISVVAGPAPAAPMWRLCLNGIPPHSRQLLRHLAGRFVSTTPGLLSRPRTLQKQQITFNHFTE